MTAVTIDEQTAARREIIHRYCRMQTGNHQGVPRFCHPTRAELDRAAEKGRPAQRRTPIIFDSAARAQECADELERCDGQKFNVYECPRSRSGHAHLSDH